MNSDILQRFLSRRLIDIGEDDTRLEKLRAAAAEVSGEILHNRSHTVRYASIAFDPAIDGDEPSWQAVAPVVERHWHTYASRFASKPQVLFRAVLLEALRQAASKDMGVAAALVAVARNLIPRLPLQSDYDAWKEVIEDADRRVSERAASEWTTNFDPAEGSGHVIARENEAPVKVDREVLAAGLLAAAGPNDVQGQAIANSNPYWPNANATWTTEFATRAAAAIAKAVNSALATAAKSDQALLPSIRESVSRALSAVSRAAVGIQRRGDLLWWKEAMCSPDTRVSYRRLPAAVAAVLMAVDLHRRVPPFHPESVEFFLAEAVRDAAGTEAASVSLPLLQVVEEVARGASDVGLAATLVPFRHAVGRGPLVGYLGDVLAGGANEASRYGAALGVAATVAVSPPEVAVWVFRELQAIAATAGPSPSLPAPQKAKQARPVQST